MVTEKVTVEEGEHLHDYEMVLIISPEVAEEKFEATIENISRFITGKGGTVASVDRWGRKKLAYPIKRFMEGSYVLARFKMKPSSTKELETNLRISEDVLRHLLVKLEG
jgi:small subunit ribosomal protein S6